MAGLFFPFYWAYPSDPPPNAGTASLIALKQKYPNLDIIVILGHVGQSAAPGNYVSYAEYWSTACNQLRAAGIKVLAYIYSNSWNITLSQTQQAADRYIDLYPQIDGFFVDEWGAQGDNPGTVWPLSDYRALVGHIKSKGNYVVWGNAFNCWSYGGWSYMDNTSAGADFYLVREHTGAMPDTSFIASMPVPKSKRSVDVYSVASGSVSDAQITSLLAVAEYISITPYNYLSVIDQTFFDRQMSLMAPDGLLPNYGGGTPPPPTPAVSRATMSASFR